MANGHEDSQAHQPGTEAQERALGVARILAQDPFGRPKSHAPHFKMNPRLAAKSKWARIETLLRNRSFQEKYRDAIKRYLGGITNVLFPFGTYWMNKFGKVACETADVPASPGIGSLVPAPA